MWRALEVTAKQCIQRYQRSESLKIGKKNTQSDALM